MSTVVLVTITLADSHSWPVLLHRANRLGALAAVLQGEGVDLITLLDQLAEEGTQEVTLIGVTFGETSVPASWVGRVARWWLATRETEMSIGLIPRPLRAVPEELPDLRSARLLRPDADTLSNALWAEPPPVRTHLLVCSGPRCSAKGAGRTLDALGAELHSRGLLDGEVLVTQTGCLFPCNRAPVVVVQPDMRWHGPVTVGDVAELIDSFAGQPVEADNAPASSVAEGAADPAGLAGRLPD